MILYRKYNFAFQHINRTGGLSVKTAVLYIAGEPDEGSKVIEFAHRPLHECLNRFSNIDDVPVYTNIRDPFSRLVSVFLFRSKKRNMYKGRDFKWFFYNVYMKDGDVTSGPTKPYIVDKTGDVYKNLKVVRFENLSSEWPEIILRHFGKKIELPKVNTSKYTDSTEYFDDEMIELVTTRDKWFIDKFYPELLRIV